MKNVITVEARRFPLIIREISTGIEYGDDITLTKDQLHAAQVVFQSSKELINRICEREGFEVVSIGKAEKRTLEIDMGYAWDLDTLVREYEGGVE